MPVWKCVHPIPFAHDGSGCCCPSSTQHAPHWAGTSRRRRKLTFGTGGGYGVNGNAAVTFNWSKEAFPFPFPPKGSGRSGRSGRAAGSLSAWLDLPDLPQLHVKARFLHTDAPDGSERPRRTSAGNSGWARQVHPLCSIDTILMQDNFPGRCRPHRSCIHPSTARTIYILLLQISPFSYMNS